MPYQPSENEIAKAEDMMTSAQREASRVRALHHVQERSWWKETKPPGIEDDSPERRPPTGDEHTRMDARLRTLGKIFRDSDIYWALDGAPNISLLRSVREGTNTVDTMQYIGIHKDIDISVERNELPEFERVLLEHGYGLFLSYYEEREGGKRVKVLERVGADQFVSDRGKQIIAAIDAEGKIKTGELLNFFEAHVVRRNTEGKPVGKFGAVLPEEWLKTRTIVFQGVPLRCAHPARIAYFKMYNTPPYHKKDLAMLVETGALTMRDIDDIERVITPEAEIVAQKKPERAREILNGVRNLREFVRTKESGE